MRGADGANRKNLRADRRARVQGLNVQCAPVPPPKGCLMNQITPTSSAKITALNVKGCMLIIADPLELTEPYGFKGWIAPRLQKDLADRASTDQCVLLSAVRRVGAALRRSGARL